MPMVQAPALKLVYARHLCSVFNSASSLLNNTQLRNRSLLAIPILYPGRYRTRFTCRSEGHSRLLCLLFHASLPLLVLAFEPELKPRTLRWHLRSHLPVSTLVTFLAMVSFPDPKVLQSPGDEGPSVDGYHPFHLFWSGRFRAEKMPYKWTGATSIL